MKYLSEEDILEIHSIVVDETGGSHGVRDLGALSAAVATARQSVFGEELYKTTFEKAAVYMRQIILNHPFVDGNKRTGMTAAIVFLEDNDFVFIAPEGAVRDFAHRVISEKLEIFEIADWLEENTREGAQ